ncbi:hypothetical protein [Labrys wisconsinensis]|uniref:Uncharacterized protein n=1 Tax=Labrys wisconsinensis TaxID=425677 RepID=A0ABU0J7M8_9HYPH|nr:hypothetical protein [Labrys wisconsinensis]MDQ0469202.1 hypothetical protein [Labrys wisconsinensis]
MRVVLAALVAAAVLSSGALAREKQAAQSVRKQNEIVADWNRCVLAQTDRGALAGSDAADAIVAAALSACADKEAALQALYESLPAYSKMADRLMKTTKERLRQAALVRVLALQAQKGLKQPPQGSTTP